MVPSAALLHNRSKFILKSLRVATNQSLNNCHTDYQRCTGAGVPVWISSGLQHQAYTNLSKF